MNIEIRKAVLEATENLTETWSNRFKAFNHAEVIEEMVSMSDEGLIRIDPHRESTSGRREIALVRVDGITGGGLEELKRIRIEESGFAATVKISFVNGDSNGDGWLEDRAFIERLIDLQDQGYTGKALINNLISDDWGPPPREVVITWPSADGQIQELRVQYR